MIGDNQIDNSRTGKAREYLLHPERIVPLLIGMVVAGLIAWAVFQWVLQPFADHLMTQAVADKNEEIRDLRNEIKALEIKSANMAEDIRYLRDTLSLLRSLGQYFGTHVLSESNEKQPLLGSYLKGKVYIDENVTSLYLSIDTCPLTTYAQRRFKGPNGYCEPLETRTQLVEGIYAPVRVGDSEYTFFCKKMYARDSVVIEVYRRHYTK